MSAFSSLRFPWRRALGAFAAGLLLANASAKEIRTALVIGNQRYEAAVGPLRNATNDARAVARLLRGLGFAVIERHDLSREQILRVVDEFRRTLAGAEVGLFYYAGHGLSVGGANYLIPIRSAFDPGGADAATLRMLAETRLFNAEQIVADMSAAGARCNLVILDACRTNRLPAGGRTRDASGRGGLVEMTPPAGSLIAFATDAGRIAFDGDGANGLYTEELLKYLSMPGLTVEQVFKRTRAGVLRRSEGGQIPAEYSRLIGDDIYLAGEMRVEPATAVAAPSAPAEAAPGLPSAASIQALAEAGQAEAAVTALRDGAAARGPADEAAGPLSALLEGVKDELKEVPAPSSAVVRAENTCRLVLEALPICLPAGHPLAADLAAKAHNRRGGARLLLGRPEEALADFEAARTLDPDDAYILYGRGQANLALGRRDEARADFLAAADPRFNQPKARKMAEQARAALR